MIIEKWGDHMNVIKYRMLIGNENGDALCSVKIPYSPENEEVARLEAYDGEFTIEDDGEEEPLSVNDRLEALERAAMPEEYEAGTWYYRGDKVVFEGGVYVCVAPAGQVCTWSPAEYAQYWKKEE